MTSTQIAKQTQSVESEATDMVARLGLPASTTKERADALAAIGKADKGEALLSALTSAGRYYSDPSTAARAADVATSFAKMARHAADEQHAYALRIVKAARKADPKVRASVIGYSVEGIDAAERNGSSKVGAAVRQRWSRYFKAVDVVEASREAVNAGKRDGMVGDIAALRAVGRPGTNVAALVETVREGGDLPVGGEVVTDAAGVESGRVYGGADVVRAANRLADVVKATDYDKMTKDQWAEVDRTLAAMREALSAGRKATPAA